MAEPILSAEIIPLAHQGQHTALALQRLGFRILHIGSTISVQGPQSLWETCFHVTFVPQRKTILAEVEGGETVYQRALTENLHIPAELQALVAEVIFVEPPEFYAVRPVP